MNPKAVQPFAFQLRPISAAVVLAMFLSAGAWANTPTPSDTKLVAEVEFNDQFLQQTGAHIDVSRFSKKNATLAGSYRVDLYVNEVILGRTEVTLRQVGADPLNVQPCFDRDLLERVGVDLTKLSPEATALLQASNGACTPLADLVKDATAAFDNSEQRLDVTVPQIAMSRLARGYVDPKHWDEGVTSAQLQYNANVYRSETQGRVSTHSYVGLNGGVNIGAWRFRHNGSLNQDDQSGTHYQAVQTNLQRSIAPIKSQLVLGDAFTDGAVFDSVGFRGVQLASDDRMYPESQRGYAPTIRGFANSNARVQIRQNGNIIYETTVASGAFEINDLYPTGYGGDLEVSVTEADGSVRVSRVPYAAAVNALRSGTTRYSVTAGQYRNTSLHDSPLMLQATVQHGFSNMVTGYGGVVVAQGYAAVLAGAALNTDYGAFGADITQAVTRLDNQPTRSGQSVRLSYSKLVTPTNTNLTLAAYRYNSEGYLSLADAMAMRDVNSQNPNLPGNGTQRGRLQMTLNQSLPAGYGSFYLTGSTQNYWNRSGSDTQFQVGYSNNYKRLNYGVSASRQYNVNTSKWDNRVMVNLSMPLGKGAHAPYATTSLQSGSNGQFSAQQSVTGTLGEDNAFSYGLNAGYNGGTGSASSVGANASYVSSVATVSGSASVSGDYRQVGVGVSGGVVAYSGGVVFTPSMGDTIAIVEAKDAAGARVANGNGLRVDRWGRAVVSNLTPFARNQVDIDPKGLPLNVELKSTSQHVAPTAGAVVRVKYETENKGRAALIRARTADGKPLPFGAEVLDSEGQIVGTVAQAGRIVVHGLRAETGALKVSLGNKPEDACTLNYALPPTVKGSASAFTAVEGECVR